MFFDIAADGNGLIKGRSVIEHEGRQHTARIHGEKLVGQVFTLNDVDLFLFVIQTFLSHEHADPARVWRAFRVVEFHWLGSLI